MQSETITKLTAVKTKDMAIWLSNGWLLEVRPSVSNPSKWQVWISREEGDSYKCKHLHTF